MADIRVFKLINGDEIVGNVTEQMFGVDTVYEISKPRQMIVQQTKQGPRSGLIPWILSAPDSTITLNKTHYYGQPVKVEKEIANYYTEVTTSIALI